MSDRSSTSCLELRYIDDVEVLELNSIETFKDSCIVFERGLELVQSSYRVVRSDINNLIAETEHRSSESEIENGFAKA